MILKSDLAVFPSWKRYDWLLRRERKSLRGFFNLYLEREEFSGQRSSNGPAEDERCSRLSRSLFSETLALGSQQSPPKL